MISGALLQRYCPDNGQCTERTDGSSGSGGDARRRMLALLLGRGSGNGSNGSGSGGWLRSLAEAAGGGGGPAGGDEPYVCNGRALWSIVGAITLSSPLLVLLTQVGGAAVVVCVWVLLLCVGGIGCTEDGCLCVAARAVHLLCDAVPSCVQRVVPAAAQLPPLIPSPAAAPQPHSPLKPRPTAAPCHPHRLQRWIRPDPRDFSKQPPSRTG